MAKKEKAVDNKLTKVSGNDIVIPRCIFSGHTDITSDGKKIIHHPLYTVTDAKFFAKLLGNRDVKKAHAEKMYESVVKNGVLREIVVIYIRETNEYTTGDGQHLLQALIMMGASFFKFILVEVEREIDAFELVSILNISQKRFSLAELIAGWSQYNDEYKDIIAFRETYDLSDRVLATLLTGFNPKAAVESVQRGEFKIINRELAHKKILAIYDFKGKTGFSNLGSYGVAGMLKLFEQVSFPEYNAHKREFTKRALALLKERKLLNVPFAKTDSAFKFFKEVWQTM